MVSSKCLKTSSPSPLRFLAALMPPWAQTEWERLTGTMEKRSTLPPASAILMTAASPARPPPTTMILGVAAAIVLLRTLSVLRNDQHCEGVDHAQKTSRVTRDPNRPQFTFGIKRFVLFQKVVAESRTGGVR